MFEMITNIFRNLISKPATRMYPFIVRPSYKDTRGRVKGIDINECIFCGLCSRKCPSNAIIVDKLKKSWEIDRFRCVVCGECAAVCPKKCIFMEEAFTKPVLKKEKDKVVLEQQNA